MKPSIFATAYSTSTKVASVLAALAVFSGCPDKGGSQTPTPVVSVAGINSNGECTAETQAAYLLIKNSNYYTDVQSIKNACLSLTNLIGTQSCTVANAVNLPVQQRTASVADVQVQCNQANGINTGGVSQPGYPQPIQNVPIKNVVCSIDVASGSAAGSIVNMPVQVFASGADYRLYANMQNTRSYWGGLFNYTKYFSSEKLVQLGLKFKAGSSTTADTLTLSAKLRNGKSASGTAFAGSEVRIEIAADNDDDTSVIVSCAGQDQFNTGPVHMGSHIRCLIKEIDNGLVTNMNFMNTLLDLNNSGILPSKNSNLTLEGNGQDILSMSVTPTSSTESYKVVTSLVSPTNVTIRAPGYSLKSDCSVQ